jgi:Fur family transcriptional regulator, stress-responsive regulator
VNVAFPSFDDVKRRGILVVVSPTDDTATEELLRAAGLRSTAPRRAVVRVLAEHPHQTAAGVAGLLDAAGTGVSRQSLHNVLDDLTRTGVLRSVQLLGSAPRYEPRGADDHHHLVCRGCGRVTDVACAAGHPACLVPVSAPGFPVVEHVDVTWWGLCADCAPADAPRTTHPPRRNP